MNNRPIEPEDDFVWEEEQTYSPEQRKELEALYDKTLKPISNQQIIKGTVVAINEKDVVLDIGFKSDGLVPLSEFKDLPDLKVGDEVEVLVENIEDKSGQLVLSRKRANTLRVWDQIYEAYENDEVLTGYIKRRTKGGLVVDIMGVEAFLPGSQIDIRPIKDFDVYVGKTMEFKVVKINTPYDNVVVSHKVLIEKDLETQKYEILQNLERGQVLEGVVKNITEFGAFIDLGGLDGLLHITDMSWGRISHPKEILSLDQTINVVVLDFDDEKKRISLGLKQLTPHPWDSLSEDIQEGSIVEGKVVTVADYGAFIEIIPGVEGLVHVSEMSWSQHARNPQEILKVGDIVKAVVLSIDREEKKMSLGIKQLTPDPWLQAPIKYAVGTRHKGIVRNITNFGLFVELEEGVDGLVHVSDLSWTKKIKHPSEFVKKDEELEVVVLEIDPENRRLSLGHKQLKENPWDIFQSVFPVDSKHPGTILKFIDKGVVVELPYGVEGFLPYKGLQRKREEYKVGDKLDLVVTEFSKENRKIIVAEVSPEKEQKEKAKKEKETAKKKEEKTTTPTLGDLDALIGLREKLAAKEREEQAKAMEKNKSKDEQAKKK
ncbi:MAG: 30S ribosomal protein S1 [Bacteroidia bacterium]|nr:30S ribosomal protein S1 [Bacteroidia bacterium]MDW8301874.1 30S ribosomal protein S1 [Bacteroidia bacterium]